MSGTKVYGASDDLIEFDGELRGEVGCYGTDDDDDMGVLLAFDDGTVLSWKYGKGGLGVWGVTVLRRGTAFESVSRCDNEDADPYSDIVQFKSGPLEAWAATSCEKVR